MIVIIITIIIIIIIIIILTSNNDNENDDDDHNNNNSNNNIKLVFPQCHLKRNVVPLLKVWITDYRYRTKESKCLSNLE